jgi:hypothetical protein
MGALSYDRSGMRLPLRSVSSTCDEDTVVTWGQARAECVTRMNLSRLAELADWLWWLSLGTGC